MSPRPLSSWRPAPSVALGLALAGVVGAGGCRHKPEGCEHDSIERCLWDRGVAQPEADSGGREAGEGPDSPDSGVSEDEREALSALDQKVQDMIDAMGVGLEWALVDERARDLCGSEPAKPPEPSKQGGAVEGAWFCELPSLQLGGQSLALEAGGGVVALTAKELAGLESADLLEFMRGRYAQWCREGGFTAIEGKRYEELYRCDLDAGPYIVVGRFPRDLEADRWQVSIAVLDAG